MVKEIQVRVVTADRDTPIDAVLVDVAPPGLLLSLGAGRAVEVTAEMLARATDRNGYWEHVSKAARKDTIELVQKWIDRLIQQAQEARDV